MKSHDTNWNCALKQGYSRRDLLKGFTAGLGGAAALPLISGRAQAATRSVAPVLSSNPPLTLLAPLQSGQLVSATGLASYGPGWIFVLTQSTASGSSSPTYDLQFVDAHSLNTVFSFVNQFNRPLSSTQFLLPVVDDTNVYTASGNSVYTVPLANTSDASQWAPLPGNATGNLVLAGGLLLVLTSDGTLTAFNAKTALKAWSLNFGTGPADFAVGPNTVYVSANTELSAWNLADGSQVFSASAANGMVTVGSDSIFITNASGINSYNLANGGAPNWSYTMTASGSQPATLYNGFLYALDSSGALHEVLPGITQGNDNRSPMPLGSDVDQSQPLVFEDGVLYAASPGGTLDLTIYPMSLAAGVMTNAYKTNVPGRFLGVENGTCFYTHDGGAAVAGVALSAQANAFFVESELMAENYSSSSGGLLPQGTSFRTRVRMQDANNNPRVNKAVKIWSNDNITLLVENPVAGGAPTQVSLTGASNGPNSAYWTTTDTMGEISIICVAANVSCPAIYLWGSFMYQVNGEYMIVYPDLGTITSLPSKASGIGSATDFSGNPVLQTQYQSAAADIATHIQNTLGGVASTSVSAMADTVLGASPSRSAGHRRPPLLQQNPNKYIAYPGSTPNLLSRGNYTQNVSATYRPYKPAATPYTCCLLPSCPATAAKDGVTFSLLGGFEDLVKDVVQAASDVAQKVESVVVSVVDDVITHVVNVAKGFYKFTVDTVEAAVASVAAVLATIANGIQSAIEWLSYVFDWGDMVANAQIISGQIQSGINQIQTYLSNGLEQATTALDNFFGDIEKNLQGYFNDLSSQYGQTSLQSHQQNGNNPQAVYSANGTNSYAKSQWMTNKVKTAIAPSPGNSSLTRVNRQSQHLSPNANAQRLGSVLSTIQSDLDSAISAFANAFKDPAALFANGLSGLLNLIPQIAIAIIQGLQTAVTSALAGLSDLLGDVLALLTTTIPIPLLEDLWTTLTSSSFALNPLNIVSLLISIPATILFKAISGQTSGLASRVGAAGGTLLFYAQILQGAIYGIFDSLSDLLNVNSNSVEAVLSMVFSAAGIGLDLVSDFSSISSGNFDLNVYLWVAISLVPLGVSLYSYQSSINSTAQRGFNFIYGLSACALAGYLAKIDTTNFLGNAGLDLMENLFTALPYVGKGVFAVGEPVSPSRIIASIIDAACDFSAAGISAALEAS